MGTEIETLSLFAFIASKCNSDVISTPTLLLSAALASLLISLLFWSHSGGPAWGKHRLSSTTSPSPIPGPRGFPIIGSMSLMSGLAHRKIAAAATSLSATRLMSFSLGSNTRVIVSCHPDTAKEILNGSAFSNRPVKESAYSLLFHRAIGFAPYGLYWRLLRRVAANHMFSPKQIVSSSPLRSSLASKLTSQIAASSAAAAFTVRDLIKKASLNNLMSSVFGEDYQQNDDVEELQSMVDEGYQLLGLLNWSDHLPFLAPFDLQGTRSRCSRLVPRVNRFVGQIINHHKTNPAVDGVNRDFVDVLLSLPAPDRLSESDMIAVLWEMIFRGTDTVAVVIEWVLARMVLHPDIQSAVHTELDNVVGRSRAVAETDLPSLVYLTAVIKEALRVHPPGPLLSWARLAVTDTVVDGHLVPAGTTAMVNMFAIACDPEFWPEPERFRPERFLTGSGSGPEFEFSVMGSDMRLAPFGSGRRSCPGKALGMATVSYWVASLMHEFEWMTSEEGATVDLSEVLKLSCEMAHPLQVRARARRSSGPSVA